MSFKRLRPSSGGLENCQIDLVFVFSASWLSSLAVADVGLELLCFLSNRSRKKPFLRRDAGVSLIDPFFLKTGYLLSRGLCWLLSGRGLIEGDEAVYKKLTSFFFKLSGPLTSTLLT